MKHLYLSSLALLIGIAGMAQNISLNHLSTYHSGVFDEGAAEIVTYDPGSQKLFYTNALDNSIGILDFSSVTLVSAGSIDLSPFGDGVNSVNAYNGVIAVAVEAAAVDQPGVIVFFEDDGTYIVDVQVGILPDMVTFSPDGNYVVVANEGEPSDDYLIDPMGSISIIDVSGGIPGLTQADVQTIDMASFGTLDPMIRIFGPRSVAPIDENFQDTSLALNNFSSVSQMSNRDWFYDSFGSDYFAEMSGFSADTTSRDWLVSPEMNLSTYASANFSFMNASNFSGGSLDLLISTDYDGGPNPELFTWDTLTGMAVWSPGGYTDTSSGPISLNSYLDPSVHIAFLYYGNPGPGNSMVWQLDDMLLEASYGIGNNLEPEYVAISANSQTAFVSLQENNGIAKVDLLTDQITDIFPLGWKDHNAVGNGLDPSNRDNGINIANYPFRGLYLPDAITTYQVGGQTYVVSANEGDSRDYDGFSEEERLKDLTLDPSIFPNASSLQEDSLGGRIKVTTTMGDTDNDGDYDAIYTYGARSFSIWSATGNLVYDSGDEFEQTLATEDPDNFNSTNDDNDSFDSRSDDKGGEPEAVEVAFINGEWFAFIGLERMGGIMVYNITDPTAPTFVQYINNRDFSVDATTAAAGDLGIEDILYISSTNSPDGGTYVVSSNEVSGTVSLFEVSGVVGIEELKSVTWRIFPNPANNVLRTNVMDTYRVTDITGREVMTTGMTQNIDLSELIPGVYFLSNGSGETLPFIKQ